LFREDEKNGSKAFSFLHTLLDGLWPIVPTRENVIDATDKKYLEGVFI